MTYKELQLEFKHIINGKLSQYTDAYIRQNKVWTPEQIHSDFIDFVQEEVDKESFTKHIKNGNVTHTTEFPMKWLLSEDGKALAMERFIKKYNKDKPVADKKSPLVERVRFGLKWDSTKFYDLNFGLKDGHNFITTAELQKMDSIPWTVEHVNTELLKNYNSNIINCLNQLATSYLEKKFVEYWKNNIYSDDVPAIIPEVCGMRPKFYYYKYNDGIYTTRKEITDKFSASFNEIKAVNFRYDFLVANFKKQKIAFIELDGFEHHKTRENQTIDSIKRNNANSLGISLLTFTSKRINEDIDAVFDELKSFLQ